MHQQLKALLHDATGSSCRVIVVFLDIRGFTSFAGTNDSTECAAFLRAMYTNIIDNYYPDAVFFKPTGDGLMVILHHPDNDDALTEAVRTCVSTSIRLVVDFPSIAASDLMVNFRTPQSLGIGIARGSVTRLHSGEFTLDYSGKYLNLAARLMDLARPRGVVFSDTHAEAFLEGLDDALFASKDVYVKGVAEEHPVRIHYTKDWTDIPSSAEARPADPKLYFDGEIVHLTHRSIRDAAENLAIPITGPISDRSTVEVHVEFDLKSPVSADGRVPIRFLDMPATFHEQPEGQVAMVSTPTLLAMLKEGKCLLDAEVRLQAKYWVGPESAPNSAVAVV